jgi:hypothetical protein
VHVLDLLPAGAIACFLPAGHRLQFTRPDDLGRVIFQAAESGREQSV